jgi:DNA primase
MSRDIETIKEKISIVDLVGSYTKLDKKGRYFKAKCPFHNENTASFTVTPERDMFHCFGCGKGGDIFAFIQDIEGLSFYEALQFLALKAGVTLSKEKPDDAGSGDKTLVYQALDMAAKIYEVGLRKNKDVVDYLLDRGLTKDTMVNFRIGFADDGWDTIYRSLKAKGFSDDVLQKAGLVTKGNKGYIDWFRDRIMFPIADTQGRVVGFTGRVFLHPYERDNPPEHKQKTGKYINSPETVVFKKSNILFGYDKAKRSMMQQDYCLVMEGQMDVIMAHQSGTTTAVALSGTALTGEHIRLIRRFTDRVIYALDADNAGREALRKGALVAYQDSMTVQVIELPTGLDPADYIKQQGIDAWKNMIETAKDYIVFETEKLAQESASDREKMQRIQKILFPVVACIESHIFQDAVMQSIARSAHYDVSAVRADFQKYIQDNKGNIVQEKNVVPAGNPRDKEKTRPVEQLLQEVLAILWSQEKSTRIQNIAQYHEKLNTIIASVENAIVDPGVFEEHREALVFKADVRYDALSGEQLSQELEDLLCELHIGLLQEERLRIIQMLTQSEQSGDETTSQQNLKKYQEISQAIEALRAPK